MKAKIKVLLVGLTLSLIAGCASLPESLQNFGKVALDRAQTISSALALRDGYIDLKDQLIANIDSFSEEEQAALNAEREQVEAFYLRIIDLSRGGNATQMVVKADDFLTAILEVRASVDRAIMIVQPKIPELNGGGALAAAEFIANYRRFSRKLDELMAKNNRAEAVRVAASFLKAAVPVIAGLLAR